MRKPKGICRFLACYEPTKMYHCDLHDTSTWDDFHFLKKIARIKQRMNIGNDLATLEAILNG